MSVEKARILACMLVYWINTNTDMYHMHGIPANRNKWEDNTIWDTLEVVGADRFTIKNNKLLCIVNYYNKLFVTRRTDGVSADSLLRMVKSVLAEVRVQKKVVTNTDTNFKFRQFCKKRVKNRL